MSRVTSLVRYLLRTGTGCLGKDLAFLETGERLRGASPIQAYVLLRGGSCSYNNLAVQPFVAWRLDLGPLSI